MRLLRPVAPSGKDDEPPLTFDEAMRRLAYVMALGGLVVFAYGVSRSPNPVAATCTGLMIAFAAALGAGLVGFIFGMPYARDTTGAAPILQNSTDEGQKAQAAANAYRPNTSLEQISDWLTKILVGVGLVEINQAPEVLSRVVRFLAPSLDVGAQARPIVAATLIFFSVCGFLFGFLWARLYLRRWFVLYDQEAFKKELVQELSRFSADGRAIALSTQQLERREDEPPVLQAKLVAAFSSASSSMKSKIFLQASAASEDTKCFDYQTVKNPGAISIFEALIADDSEKRYHRNHAELSMALDRRGPPDLKAAIEAMSTAIARRDALGRGGWRYWEFRRALNRIKLSSKVPSHEASDPAMHKAISDDLEAVRAENPGQFKTWVEHAPDVSAWLKRRAG
jgi:hypothetical protein